MDFSQAIAIVWLCGCVAAIGGYALRLMLKSDYDAWESVLYFPTYVIGRLLWRVEFTNSPPAEIRNGALLVANHRSSVDPFFVQLAARRRVHWMVAREYCTHFLFGPFLRLLEVIPTNRSGMDTAATKAAIRMTKEGRLVGMFPEGRLNHTRQPLVSIRSGAAVVAQRAGVPIIPLFIQGSPYRRTVWSPLLMAGHVIITFGQPIFPANANGNGRQTGPAELDDGNSGTSDEAGLRTGGEFNGDDIATQRASTDSDLDHHSADEMILQWGRQVVALAGHPSFNVELASRRKRRK